MQIWRMCNKAFLKGIVPKTWRRTITTPFYKGQVRYAELKDL